jgi:anthraniloyl-CoA monooxygenase
LLESPPTTTDSGGPWGAWIGAPDDETGLAAARRHLRVLIDAGAAVTAVHGGTELTRRLVSEEARFVHGCPSVIVDPCLDRDGAVTAVLSGRADAVGAHPATVDAWVGGP